jgi:ATP-dependent DNA helicase PIF1
MKIVYIKQFIIFIPDMKIVKMIKNLKENMDEYQQKAYDAAINGESIFISAGPGFGKTYLLQELRKKLKCVAMSPQWSSAFYINGKSINSALQIKPNIVDLIEYTSDDFNKTNCGLTHKFIKGNLDKKGDIADIYIIDEISQVSGDLLFIIDLKLRIMFENDKPFGDRQIIVCGDFAQLGPINYKRFKYAFESPSWNFIPYILKKCHRQDEEDFIHALENIRKGGNYSFFKTSDRNDAIKECLNDDNSIALFPTHSQCSSINNRKLRDINASAKGIPAIDISYNGKVNIAHESGNYIYPELLILKEGAKSILIKSTNPKQLFYNGRVVKIIKIETAYCSNIHDALSPESQIEIFNMNSYTNRTIGKTLMKKFSETHEKIPFYRLTIKLPTGETLVLSPSAEIKESHGKIMSMRIQFPILLGWAITLHRSQGMTIDKGIVCVDNVFTHGMVYMGISRFKSMERLKIIGELPEKCDVDEKVLKFLSSLE